MKLFLGPWVYPFIVLLFALARRPPVVVHFLPSRPRVHGRHRWLHAALAGLLLAGCQPSTKDPTPDQKDAAKSTDAAADSVPVETVAVTRGPISAFLSFNSTLETEAAVDIYPQATGQVEALFVEEGHRVPRGQPLLQIDDRQLRVELQDAEVNARYLAESFARIETLSQRQLLNQQEFEDKKFQLDQARLRVERARIALDYATVRAPFDCVITARDVQVGARVSPSSKLFSIVKLDEIVARVHAPGRYLPAIALEQPASITSEFAADQVFEGWVKRISPVIDPRSGTFKVTVGVRGSPADLAPGLFVNVRIVTATRDTALLIPKGAIVYDGGERYVFAVVDGRASRRKLELGFEGLDHVEALSGFDVGTPVVVRGQNGLKDGAPLRIVPPAGTPDAAANAVTVAEPPAAVPAATKPAEAKPADTQAAEAKAARSSSATGSTAVASGT